MELKRVEMYGFKSFAEKTDIKFENGITAVVGPNGCGKSNVADAIRWVLGEQSAKLLRGKNMSDLIFSGTDTRKSLSYCEVSLFFDNSDKSAAIDYVDVVISRKLYKSGESEYLINRQTARLKDISDLLHDGGMGREGFSIIGQGKIDEILSAKPDDRRAIFEEAVGISKIKQRKSETERKLLRAHDNILRLSDVLTELERQLSPLKKQSEDAKKFLELKEKLKIHEVNVFLEQFGNAASAKSAVNTRLNAADDELKHYESLYAAASGAYDESLGSIENADKLIRDLHDEELSLTVNIEKQAGEEKLHAERAGFLKQQSERLEREIAGNTAECESLAKELKAQNARLESERAKLEKLRAEHDGESEKYLALTELINQNQDESEQSNRQIIDALGKLSDARADEGKLSAEAAALKNKINDNEKRIADLAAKGAEFNKAAADAAKNLAAQTELKSKETEKRNGVLSEYNTLTAQIKDASESYEAVVARRERVSANLEALARVKENFEGFAPAVKRLLTDAKTAPALNERIEGLVCDLLKTPEKYQVAIETALGAALQNIVVKTEDDAKYLIAYLKEKRYGRITFLPVTSVKPRVFSESAALSEEGVLGVADTLVKFDPRFKKIYSSLLGGTVVVTDIDKAVVLARKYKYNFRIVTTEGDLISPQGAVTGGSRQSAGSDLLGLEQRAEKLRGEEKAAAAALKSAEKLRAEMSAERENLLTSVRVTGEKIASCDAVAAGERQKELKNKEWAAAAEREADALFAENKKLAARLAETEKNHGELKKLSGKIASDKEGASGEIAAKHKEYDKYKAERDAAHERLTENKVGIAKLSSRLSASEEDVKRIEKTLAALTETRGEAERRLSANAGQLEIMERREFAGVSKEEAARLAEIKDKLNNLDAFKEELTKKRNSADKERTELTFEISKIHDKKFKEEYNLTKIDSDIELMQTRIAEEYGLTHETAGLYKQENYDVKRGQNEINKLKKDILSLGFVNVNAIDDYRETAEIYAGKAEQKEDLEKAERDMQKAIAELSAEMSERFNKGFSEINENFKKIFRELFGGGRANLVLEELAPENTDPLSAGIDIQAEPPGKRLQSVSLLSGGERAMTAIAILFAILKLRPMPFCVLDEIEAALDDANALRFASYLQKFSKSTQFIVITHKKTTMEHADALYGVTMEEKGVSKMVSVKLAQAVEHVL